MNERFPRLPPLASLRGFEAAARLGSFSRAADELFVTQSAISHQIRVLEEHFEQPLFLRVGRSVELTDAGVDFLGTAAKVLQALDRGSRRLVVYSKQDSVVVYAPQSFAARWLTPRLSLLREEHADIEPWISSFENFPDLETTEMHLAISFTENPVSDWVSEDLMEDAVVPLCHPGLLEKEGDLDISDFLEKHQLLHDERQLGWSDWLRHAKASISDPLSGTSFSEPGLALDAALYKQGVVLGSVVLAETDIEDGRLVPLSGVMLKTPETYRLLCHEDSLKSAAVSRMRDWIIAEAEQSRAALQVFHLYPEQGASPFNSGK